VILVLPIASLITAKFYDDQQSAYVGNLSKMKHSPQKVKATLKTHSKKHFKTTAIGIFVCLPTPQRIRFLTGQVVEISPDQRTTIRHIWYTAFLESSFV
jgi:hypothetical protein